MKKITKWTPIRHKYYKQMKLYLEQNCSTTQLPLGNKKTLKNYDLCNKITLFEKFLILFKKKLYSFDTSNNKDHTCFMTYKKLGDKIYIIDVEYIK